MNKLKELKGIWIPLEILLNKDLTINEQTILSIILCLGDEDDVCFATNQYIANITGITSNSVSRIISSLKKKKYVEVILQSKNIEKRKIIPNKDYINQCGKKYLIDVDVDTDEDKEETEEEKMARKVEELKEMENSSSNNNIKANKNETLDESSGIKEIKQNNYLYFFI